MPKVTKDQLETIKNFIYSQKPSFNTQLFNHFIAHPLDFSNQYLKKGYTLFADGHDYLISAYFYLFNLLLHSQNMPFPDMIFLIQNAKNNLVHFERIKEITSNDLQAMALPPPFSTVISEQLAKNAEIHLILKVLLEDTRNNIFSFLFNLEEAKIKLYDSLPLILTSLQTLNYWVRFLDDFPENLQKRLLSLIISSNYRADQLMANSSIAEALNHSRKIEASSNAYSFHNDKKQASITQSSFSLQP